MFDPSLDPVPSSAVPVENSTQSQSGVFSSPIAVQQPFSASSSSLALSSTPGTPAIAPGTILAERGLQRCGDKRRRDTAGSTADESSIDHTEDEMDDCGGMAGSASIASLRLVYAALPMVPRGFVVAGLVPGQVVDLGHAISLRDSLVSKTFDVLESLVRRLELEGLPPKGSCELAEELVFPVASKTMGKRKRMRVATVPLTQDLENGIKVLTIHLL